MSEAHVPHCRARRIAAGLENQLAAPGFSEIDVYEKLAQSKTYRQLQRTVDDLFAELERDARQFKPQPYRKPRTPGPHKPCSCGSNIMYKKCCSNPLPQQPRAA